MKNQDLYIAMYYMRLGEHEKWVRWFERGYENRDVDVHYAVALPEMQNIFEDPRLKHIPEEVGLPRY